MRAFPRLQLDWGHGTTGEWGLQVCFLQIRMLKLAPQGDGVRRWGLWEVTGSPAGSLMTGLAGDPRERPRSLYRGNAHREGSRRPPATGPGLLRAGTLASDLQAAELSAVRGGCSQACGLARCHSRRIRPGQGFRGKREDTRRRPRRSGRGSRRLAVAPRPPGGHDRSGNAGNKGHLPARRGSSFKAGVHPLQTRPAALLWLLWALEGQTDLGMSWRTLGTV